jgi:hypothetical protein
VSDGVFVLGMHRGGTSAATRLISFLGLETPRGEDLVPPSAKNPKGYWESMSLVALNTRILANVGSDPVCPVLLESAWFDNPRLDDLREEARVVFASAFPVGPWVWKDPRTCLTFSFWRRVLNVQPIVVVVHRNPLEIAASSARTRRDARTVYTLALWERYLRQALEQIVGSRVLVARYADIVSDPIGWSRHAREFLTAAGIRTRAPVDADVLEFIDPRLRHAIFTDSDVRSAEELSPQQHALDIALDQLRGGHDAFVLPNLPSETPTTDTLLAERRRAREIERELARVLERERAAGPFRALARSRQLASLRRIYARASRGRSLL